MLISVVIRTLNEARYLEELLCAVRSQNLPSNWAAEVVLVDSGSTDGTCDIAGRLGCRIEHIAKEEFTFGRSLNRGCDLAQGEILVIVSGHCVPASSDWLQNLVAPLVDGIVDYAYGRQIGRDSTKFSERRVFKKYFPDQSHIPQGGIFANNANAAVTREAYERYRFHEELTGLEDMFFAKQLVEHGGRIGYVAEAPVYHIHNESWPQVRRRYEREAIALAEFMPYAAMSFQGFITCFLRAVVKDSYWAMREGVVFNTFISIILFRFNQYWGGFEGSRIGREMSRIHSKDYFYPDRHYIKPSQKIEDSYRPHANKSTQ